MIGYLQGSVLQLSLEESKIILGVGTSQSQVGYQVFLPLQASSYATLQEGQDLVLWVHTHVREEQLDLYGFLSQEEKILFLMLLGVSGVGPRSALSVLGKAGVDILCHALSQENPQALQQVPGIGKKTAEKIILELKGSFHKKYPFGLSPLKPPLASEKTLAPPLRASSPLKDVRGALMGLGYREMDIDRFLERFFVHTDATGFSAEELIRQALKEFSQGVF